MDAPHAAGAAMTLPAIFISHGPPSLELEQSVARDFLSRLGEALPRPEAILCISAHWEGRHARLGLAERPETIHDFFGFPDALYELRYPAPGAPDLARRAAELLEAQGQTVVLDESYGLDHGAWSPLRLIYPAADLPVTQLSLLVEGGPAAHLAIGRALAPLRDEGVLVLGSGGATHNLAAWRRGGEAAPAWAQAFDDWLVARVEAGAVEDLVDYRRRAPEGPRNHPSEEHFLPLFVALGAAEGPGRVLHRSFQSTLSMAAFAFG